jgi:hypothetical protein
MKKTDGRKSRDTVPLVHYFFVFFLPEPITKRGIELSIWLSSRKMPTGSNSGSTIDEERKVRLKEKRHKRTRVKGVCKECSRRTNFRCICCDVALHPDECFYLFHVPEEEREEVE